MTGQVPFMNSYSPVHSHEIGHLGRFKPLAGAGGIPSYIPIPQFSVRVNKRTVIGMMVFLLGSNEEVAGGSHAGTSSGTDGGIRNAVRPPVDIHHLLFLSTTTSSFPGSDGSSSHLSRCPGIVPVSSKYPVISSTGIWEEGTGEDSLPVVPQDENKNGTHRQETNGWKRDNFISISRITALDSWRPEKEPLFDKTVNYQSKNLFSFTPALRYHIRARLPRSRPFPVPRSRPWDQASAKVRAASAVWECPSCTGLSAMAPPTPGGLDLYNSRCSTPPGSSSPQKPRAFSWVRAWKNCAPAIPSAY